MLRNICSCVTQSSTRVYYLFAGLLVGIYFVLQPLLGYIKHGVVCSSVLFCFSSISELILVAISRFTAGIIYPTLFIAVLTKARFLCYKSSQGWLSEVVPFHNFDAEHQFAAKVMFGASVVHSIAHLVRICFLSGASSHLISHETGISGIIALSLLFFVSIPFMSPILKRLVSFEHRKAFHYLFVLFFIAMSFHKLWRTFIIFTTLCGFIVLDYILSMTLCMHCISSCTIDAVGEGIAIVFSIPISMSYRPGQYVYVNIPWIAKYEWHAFSLMVRQDEMTREASIFVMVSGEWTGKLHKMSLQHSKRPILWLHGPHSSPFDHFSGRYTGIVIVASGVGITPAVSVIEEYHNKRDLFMIWICRDRELIEFFLPSLCKIQSRIFYTGNELDMIVNNPDLGSYIPEIFQGRPQISEEVAYGLGQLQAKQHRHILYCGSSTALKQQIGRLACDHNIGTSFEFFQSW